jgi:hypothetical protein
VAPDLAISVTDALKVEGSLGHAILIGDMLKYSISVSVEACFVEQLRDIVMVHRIPRGIKLENTLQAINVQPKADGECESRVLHGVCILTGFCEQCQAGSKSFHAIISQDREAQHGHVSGTSNTGQHVRREQGSAKHVAKHIVSAGCCANWHCCNFMHLAEHPIHFLMP